MSALRIGSQGAEVFRFWDYCSKYAASYAFLLGKRDGYYGNDEAAFTRELQRRLGLPITGIFGDPEAARIGYRWSGTATPPAPPVKGNDWIYTFPGSGANFDQGPSFELGVRAERELGINHQPVYFQKGGYLGFMGGDPKFSYIEVTWDQCKSLEWLWDHNAAIQQALTLCNNGKLAEAQRLIRIILSGYSQSADGAEDALEWLCTPGFVHPGDPSQTPSPGRYAQMRECIAVVVQFGNPSTVRTGIARKTRSPWLAAKVRNVNKPNDFYAVATDKIRPPMYAIIVRAEMELPFFVHVLRLAARIVPEWLTLGTTGGLAGGLGGLLGGLTGGLLGGGTGGGAFGPLAQVVVGGLAGVGGNPLFGQMFGMAGGAGDTQVDEDLYNLLKPTGVLASIPDMIGLIAALPGLQAHGSYFEEDVNQAYSVVAQHKR